MKLSELEVGKKIVVQIVWGERSIQYIAEVASKTDVSILVTPYFHKGKPLVIFIESRGNVTCNVFATDIGEDKLRQTWNDVELRTVESDGGAYYYLTHKKKLHMNVLEERRKHERVKINKKGRLLDKTTYSYFGTEIVDISDEGIGFSVSENLNLENSSVTLTFEEMVNGNHYDMRVECMPVRSCKIEDGYFWGCRILDHNKDFLLYSFLVGVANKISHKKDKS